MHGSRCWRASVGGGCTLQRTPLISMPLLCGQEKTLWKEIFSFETPHLQVRMNDGTSLEKWTSNLHSHPSCVDLEPVSDLMVKAFFRGPSSLEQHHYRNQELNRLRQNFPGEDNSQHRLLVAVEAQHQNIIGFCIVENRPPTPSHTYFKL